jgi:two-component system chemotaxis sensor kinase CheA
MSLTKIFDTLLEPVFILNVSGGFFYCNSSAAVICDLSERRVLRSKKLQEVFKFEVEISWLTDLTKITDSTPYIEVSFQTHSGKKGKAQITAQPYEIINDCKTILVYFRDVTLEETLQIKYRGELEQKEKYIKDLETAHNELENYSKNLEKMVEERTFEIRSLNSMMTALLDSLTQGFFLFDKNGLCLSVASKACLQTLECHPVNKFIWDILKIPTHRIDGFKKWLLTLFSEMLPFEDLAPLGPVSFEHSEGRHIHLEYYPLLGTESTLEAIVVVATDTTHLDEAKQEAEKEKSYAKMIINMIRRKKEITQFISETNNIFQQLDQEIQFLKQNHPQFSLDALMRHLHTIKGGAATFSLPSVANECHIAESVAAELKTKNHSLLQIENLQRAVFKIHSEFDSFLNSNQPLLGSAAVQGIRTVEIPVSEIRNLVIDLNKNPLTRKLSEKIETHYLLTKIETVFQSYDDVIHQVASVTGKKVNPLKIIGGSVSLVEKYYSELFASLVHQFRNAVDHGIENEETRTALGKNSVGSIIVSVSALTDSSLQPRLKIEIQDDGKGIDPLIIRSKLKEKGILLNNESDDEILQHVFDSQFSTSDQITETSGRGVGMDAIKEAANNMKGRAWIESHIGKGTTLHIEVPYIQSEIPTMVQEVPAAAA